MRTIFSLPVMTHNVSLLSRNLEINCCVGTECLEIIENKMSANLYSKKHTGCIQQLTQNA